ncbi:MAG: multidrug ABC transporter [Acutalibacteraceae bacterium]
MNDFIYYIGILATALASAISQILLNVSAKKKYDKKIFEYLNPWVISSYAILAITLVANVYIMRFIPLKIAHVLAASTYVFVAILSRLVFKEKISVRNVIGLCILCVGIIVFIL